MKETTLVILAAGIGSRFGGGIKQLAAVGPNGRSDLPVRSSWTILSMMP